MQRIIPCAWVLLACALPAVADFRISPSDGASHSYPSLCRQPDGFVAAWETAGATGRDVTVQRLDVNGQLRGASTRADQSDAGDQQLPDIACRMDGSFLLVWESRDQDGDGLGVYGRNFDAEGSPTGDEFRINTHTADHQRGARVCVDDSGRAVVVWSSFGQDGDGDGIYGQRFDAEGMPSGAEFPINSDTDGNQNDPVIACSGEGDHLAAWKHRRADSSGTDIHGRRFDSAGVAAGDEFQINETAVEGREHPAAAAVPGGGYTVAYTTTQTETAGGISVRSVGDDGELGVERIVDLDGRGRHEAPAVDLGSTGELLLAWSRGAGFEFDIAGIRIRPDTSVSPVFAVGRTREGNDGAISTFGRGLDIATDPLGDLVVWQKREVFEADSSASIFAQRFEHCSGDCSGDGVVRINELIQAVAIALNQAPLSACESIDRDGGGAVEINELIRSVNEALAGICPAPIN
jgi:hypothetical protein